jgi:hypothetical protein
MLIREDNLLIFKIKTVYFADRPFDVDSCDAVYFNNCNKKVNALGFTCEKSLNAVTDLTQDLEVIQRKIDKKSTWYEIKRAQEEEIKITSGQHYDEFYQIHSSFLRKKGISSIVGVGAPNIQVIKKYGTLFTFEYEGEILGGQVYLEDKNHLRLWLSSSKRLEVDKEKASLISRANRLLHWEAIKYAKEKGKKEFDWGGLWSREELSKESSRKGLNSFKLSFGGKLVTQYSYYKSYSISYKLSKYLYGKASLILGRRL